MIQVDQVSKRFQLSKKQQKENNTNAKEQLAVDNVSFSCSPGRVFSLLGPNGAGKTTTLRMIATIFQPSSGSIKVAGHDVMTEPQMIRSKIGFLTGSTSLYARLTADETINYFAKLYGVNDSELKKRKDYLYDLLNMSHFLNKRVGKMSTGMKQKVSICRTMIHDPEVVIFDEPTSGLDVITAENIIALIKQCKTDGKTVIFSSHIMSEVDLLCDDLAIMHKGKICYSGSMDEFRSSMQADSLTAEFIRIVKSTETEAHA